ncbi:Mrr restriction system protein [Sphingomonas canadensis]|uniref:Mrr restriction system protein n=1 Tax=Sphingomonas canadensis TaxID=1219257 RepID=A0ABW3H7L0_9SPHN|nr:Mrr restriction system protein [Sphingomonas canadensis]MCW3836100.1 Mrr restriction system protein [Sphingomonas canadensis]
MRRLFEILLAEPEGVGAAAALEAVRASMSLTKFESDHYPSGGQRFEKILRFATIDCVKAGWLHKNKGIWTVTEAGRQAYLKYADPEAFYKEACRLYGEWKAQRDATSVQPGEAAEPEAIDEAAEKLSVTVEAAIDHAWTEISAYLHSTDPFEFQEMVAGLLRAMGYHVAWVSPPGKDNGVDVIAFTDPLGATGPRIKAQVKRWQSKIDSDGLKSFLATLSTGDVGIYVCLAGFTKDAQDYARNQETRRVTLIDARRFFDMWVEHYPRLGDEAQRQLPLVPVYFLAPPD